MLRELKWQILADRYNWCQGPLPGRGPAVEKHCTSESTRTYLSLQAIHMNVIPGRKTQFPSTCKNKWRPTQSLRRRAKKQPCPWITNAACPDMVSYDHVTRYVVKSTPVGNQYLNTHTHAISNVLEIIKLWPEITNVGQNHPHTKYKSLQNTHIPWLLPSRVLPTCMLITCPSI